MKETTEIAIEQLIKRIETSMASFEDVEHRVATVIEGSRTQLSHLAESLKIRQIRGEFRDMISAVNNLAAAIRETKEQP